MNKKKAIICTALLYIVAILAVYASIFLVKNDELNINLFRVISPWIVGAWMGEKIKRFYYWLIESK